MASAAPAKIDFKQYRTTALFEAVNDLIDWRGTIGRGFYWTFLATIGLAAIVTTGLCIASHAMGAGRGELMLTAVVLLLVDLPASLPAGLFFSIAYLIRRSLANMLQIVDLLLETTKTVAQDVRSLRSGHYAMPSPKELVHGVYLEVFLPIIEQVIASQLWFLAKPALFLYRLSFGRLVHRVIQFLPEKTLDPESEQAAEEKLRDSAESIKRGMIQIADNETTVVGALNWSQQKLHHLGGHAKFMIMLPCYVVVAVVAGLAVAVMVLVWFVLHTMFSWDTATQ